MTTREQQEYDLGLKNQDDRRLIESKHQVWIYTGVSNPKLQKLIDESVSISELS